MTGRLILPKRDKSFDIAKGIGMLAVILGHLALPVWLSKFIFSFHMPLFFLINGYFFKPESVETFTEEKLRTLILPYILTCLIVMLSSVFWNVLRQMSIPEIMADAGGWFWASVYGSGTITEFCGWHFRIIGAIWFLLAMFWADIIFDIILLKTKHACIWGMAIAAVGYITSAWIWLPFSFQAGLTAMLFVWIGYKVRQEDLLNKYLDNIWLLALALVLWLNSIIVLCIHLIELDTFPWYVISNRLPYALGIIVLFVLKVMMSVMGVWGVEMMGRVKMYYRQVIKRSTITH